MSPGPKRTEPCRWTFSPAKRTADIGLEQQADLGDNKLILSSLKTVLCVKKLKTKAASSWSILIPLWCGGRFFHGHWNRWRNLDQKPSVLEEIAYRDTWGKGADSFISMIYERLVLMRDLLAENGSIYVHCDWRVNAFIRLTMNEVFGVNRFVSEIIWKKNNCPFLQLNVSLRFMIT